MPFIQIDVPRSIYGHCDWFAPKEMRAWLKEHGLGILFVGSRSSGNGYTNGVRNDFAVYHISFCNELDATAFKIMFPECLIYCSQFS